MKIAMNYIVIITFIHLNDVDVSPHEAKTGKPCIPEQITS